MSIFHWLYWFLISEKYLKSSGSRCGSILVRMATHSQVDGGFIERFIYHFIENVVAQRSRRSRGVKIAVHLSNSIVFFPQLTTRRSSVTQPLIPAPDPLELLMCHWFGIGVGLSFVPFIASGCFSDKISRGHDIS